MHIEVFYLLYNTKQMHHYGYWKRQRGLSNSKSLEQALYVYKGRVPKNMPKQRMFVDIGSSLFNQVLKNVPVLAPKHQAFVSRPVREKSLFSMVGIAHTEDDSEKKKLQKMEEDDDTQGLHQPDVVVQQDKDLVVDAKKKRKLYRQISGTNVPWFPHDNDMELLKELCWEAGKPRWVFHGTPAGGAGVHGCLEAGCSVVALCYDEHHREHLQKFFLERAVEAMVTGTTLVFKDDVLQARSIQLKLTPTPKATSANRTRKAKENESEGEEDIVTKPKKVQDQKAEKKKKEQKPKVEGACKKKATAKITAKSESSDSDSDSSDSESESGQPAKKVKKLVEAASASWTA